MPAINSVQVSLDKNMCEVLWCDSHVSRFHAIWLRCNCQCDDCRKPFPGAYRIDPLKFSEDLKINSADATEDGLELRAQYNGDSPEGHVSVHPADWLRAMCYCDACLKRKVEDSDVISRYVANNDMKREVPVMDNDEIRKDSDRGLFKLTKHLIEEGFCVVKNVPTEPGTVIKFANQIALLEHSTYGKLFDVFVKDTEHSAFTSYHLPFHQDVQYYESSPGVQLLHAISSDIELREGFPAKGAVCSISRFDDCVKGGESKLVDMFEAVEILRQESPEHFNTLVEVPATYHTIFMKGDTGRYYVNQKYPVRIDYFGKVVGVNWHPGHHTTPQVREGDVERYYAAHCAMLKVVRRRDMQYRLKLDCGDLMIFNNRRMAHAREAFETNGGVRHLQGAYVRLDDLKSKYMTLAHKLGIKVTPPKVGNTSSF